MSTRIADRPTAPHLDVSLIEKLLADPDLFAPALPDETPDELAARRAAAADITDDLINASIARDGIDHVADLVHRRVQVWTTEAQTQVAAWLAEIRGAAA